MANVAGIIGVVRGLSPLAKAAVAATALLAVVLALSLWAFAAALFGPSPEGIDPEAGAQRQAEEHRAAFERHVAYSTSWLAPAKVRFVILPFGVGMIALTRPA